MPIREAEQEIYTYTDRVNGSFLRFEDSHTVYPRRMRKL
jgi:hypothetical protein